MNKLSEEQIKTLSSKTSLSVEKIREWHCLFLSYMNKDGHLSKKNFIKLYKELLPEKGDSESFCTFAFKAFDADQSGYIDLEEFILSLSMSLSQNMQDRLEWMFETYDQNNDGVISYNEFRKIIKAIYQMMNIKLNKKMSLENHINSIFKQLDQNDDNTITRYEFVEGCKKDEFLFHFLSANI